MNQTFTDIDKAADPVGAIAALYGVTRNAAFCASTLYRPGVYQARGAERLFGASLMTDRASRDFRFLRALEGLMRRSDPEELPGLLTRGCAELRALEAAA